MAEIIPNIPNDIEEVDDVDITPVLRAQQYDLRFTFSDQTSEHEYLTDKCKLNYYKFTARQLKEKILTYAYAGKVTGGLEVKNKMGEHTRAHVHFRFLSNTKKDTMVKPFKRLIEYHEFETSTNKYWYFKALPEQDIAKFWRYPLKETLMPSLCAGFKEDELKTMAQVANATLQTAIQINQKRQDNRDPTDTLFQRLCIYLRKLGKHELSAVVTAIIQFYTEENRPLNRTVIVGYAYTYLIKDKHLEASALAQTWLT